MPKKTLDTLLKAHFVARHATAAINHYQSTVEEFQKGEWENSIAKGGKFTEAVLKALWAHVGETVPTGKSFKVGAIIDGLKRKPTTFDDTVRLTIPRACRLVYDVASNRGGRHDSGDVDPNQMDATLVVANCSWILAEMLRYSQKGSLDMNVVAEMVASLTQRKYPFVEQIDGRLYFFLKGLSARDVALLTLWRIHPRRMNKEDLIQAAKRHGNRETNAKMGVARLHKLVDDDGAGNFRLLISGIQQAEALIASKQKSSL